MVGNGIIAKTFEYHKFTLYCDKTKGSNSIEVDWLQNFFMLHVFKLDHIISQSCSDNTSYPLKKNLRYNTIKGLATGTYDGRTGIHITYTFTDAEDKPLLKDSASLVISDTSGNVLLNTSGNLIFGDQEAY
jgi:hypothetical protein